MRAARSAPALLVLLAAACSSPELGPLMAAGQDCLGCHDGATARRWTVAGTWHPGARVTVADAAGKSFTLHANKVGNFYSAEPVVFPLAVGVDGKTMPALATYGGCNRCHSNVGTGQTGPLMLPGQDCLACHDGAQALRWTVAGTWSRAGATVTLADSRGRTVTLTTNQVGNFYTSQALAFPLTARVGGQQMPDPVTYGGCNRCHGSGGGGGD